MTVKPRRGISGRIRICGHKILIGQLTSSIMTDTRDRVMLPVHLRYDITDFLYVQGQAGMDWYTLRRTSLTPQGTGYQPWWQYVRK